jgi:hypothetical protein
MWKQRFRGDWLKYGDRYTSYFHRKTSWRAKKNNISQWTDRDGTVSTEEKRIKEISTWFFKVLYIKDKTVEPHSILHLFHTKINAETNDRLSQEFTNEEISNALFQIGPMEALGHDGFPARFFQRNWGFMKEEITVAVKNFFRTCYLLEGTNDTSVFLIQKN